VHRAGPRLRFVIEATRRAWSRHRRSVIEPGGPVILPGFESGSGTRAGLEPRHVITRYPAPPRATRSTARRVRSHATFTTDRHQGHPRRRGHPVHRTRYTVRPSGVTGGSRVPVPAPQAPGSPPGGEGRRDTPGHSYHRHPGHRPGAGHPGLGSPAPGTRPGAPYTPAPLHRVTSGPRAVTGSPGARPGTPPRSPTAGVPGVTPAPSRHVQGASLHRGHRTGPGATVSPPGHPGAWAPEHRAPLRRAPRPGPVPPGRQVHRRAARQEAPGAPPGGGGGERTASFRVGSKWRRSPSVASWGTFHTGSLSFGVKTADRISG